jgi:hypothetical protein
LKEFENLLQKLKVLFMTFEMFSFYQNIKHILCVLLSKFFIHSKWIKNKNIFDEIQFHLDENEMKNVQSSKSIKQCLTFSFFFNVQIISISLILIMCFNIIDDEFNLENWQLTISSFFLLFKLKMLFKTNKILWMLNLILI